MYHFAVVALLALAVLKVADLLEDFVPGLARVNALLTYVLAVAAAVALDYSLFKGFHIPVRDAWMGSWFTGFIVGSLGVLNDVTVTQASAVWALKEADPSAGARTLYRRAMRIGRDHIASTVDTLVLAYAGAALPLLLLFTLASRPIGDVLTGGLVAEEIVRTLVGGIGLVASVPVTTGLAAMVAARRSGEKAAGVSA